MIPKFALGAATAAALLLAGPTRVKHLLVEGRQIVTDGHVTTLDMPTVIARQNRLAMELKERM